VFATINSLLLAEHLEDDDDDDDDINLRPGALL
jgi:hypothetical protein